jgi:hypothetical protein
MVIDNLDILSIFLHPSKANSVLVVDANAELAFSITLQCFKSIASDLSQILERRYSSEAGQLHLRFAVQLFWQRLESFFRAPAVVDVFRCSILEASYAHRIPNRLASRLYRIMGKS